ncbi:hypothetical protein apy_01910 [Aeropyrum pernix]|uniref:DUF4443 domain-containing protein n=2 Tax=Aeropyrum pernix TaxID=56636 RepID=A0A401H7M9_AERPX|nr:hypothetical protein apy_01910 [Aeropyrum pernix]
MLGRSECILLKSVLEMARPRKGGTPTFTAYHAARALDLLEGERLGRQRLARSLGLGEASTRTLLEIMGELGLVEKAGRGFQPTGRGRELARTLSRVIRVSTGTANPIPGGAAIILPNIDPPEDLTSVYKIRDYLVEEGCKVAVIGGTQQGRPVFPGVEGPPVTYIVEAVEDLGITGSSTIIFVPRTCLPQAYNAALRIVVERLCK